MSSGLARYSAMLCALLTLVAAAWWLLHGAPDVADINSPGFESRQAAEQFFQSGLLSFGIVTLSGMHHVLPWISQAALAITCLSIVACAGASLYLLRRDVQGGYARPLGLALGWWSLGFGYLWLFSVVRSAGIQPAGVAWRLLLDAGAFQLMLAAGTATLGFIASFPSPVPEDELMRFLTALWRSHPRIFGLVHEGRAAQGGETAAELPERRRLRIPLWVTAGGVLAVSLFWRPSFLSASAGAATLLMLLAFVVFCALVGRPAVSALRHFKFHRLTGSADDRRRAGQLQAGLWVGACVVGLLAVLTGAILLGTGHAQGQRPEAVALRLLELGVFACQPVVLAALAISILPGHRPAAG